MTANRLLAYGAGVPRVILTETAFGNGVVILLASQLMPLAASRAKGKGSDRSEKRYYPSLLDSRVATSVQSPRD